MKGLRELGLMAAGALFSFQAAAQELPQYNLRLEHADDSAEEYEELHGNHTFDVRDSTRYEISFEDDTFVGDMHRRGYKVDFLVDHRDGSHLRLSQEGEETKELSGMFLRRTENSATCSLKDRICMMESTRGHLVVERPEEVVASTRELGFRMEDEPPEQDVRIQQNVTIYNVINIINTERKQEVASENEWLDWNVTAGLFGERANGYEGLEDTDTFSSEGLGARLSARYRSEDMNLGSSVTLWKRDSRVERCNCVETDEGWSYRVSGDALFGAVDAFAVGASGERSMVGLEEVIHSIDAGRLELGANTEHIAAAVGPGVLHISSGDENYHSLTLGGRAAFYEDVGVFSVEASASYDAALEQPGKQLRGEVSVSLDYPVSPFASLEAGYTELENTMRRHVDGTIGLKVGGI